MDEGPEGDIEGQSGEAGWEGLTGVHEEDLLSYRRRDTGIISGALAVIGRAISAGPITAGALEILPLSHIR